MNDQSQEFTPSDDTYHNCPHLTNIRSKVHILVDGKDMPIDAGSCLALSKETGVRKPCGFLAADYCPLKNKPQAKGE